MKSLINKTTYIKGWLHEAGMNWDQDEARTLQRHYVRPGWNAIHIKCTKHFILSYPSFLFFSTAVTFALIWNLLHEFEKSNFFRSDISFFVFFRHHFISETLLCENNTPFLHTRPLMQCPISSKTQTGLNIFAMKCRPGPKLTRSFFSVHPAKEVVPVWVEILYRSHVIR